MYNTKLYEIQTNRSLKLYESLVGKKIIKESVASGITAIENLKNSGKLKKSVISALENLPLSSADDLAKAIEKIIPSFRKDSISRKVLESDYISIEDKGKYLELLTDDTKVIEARKFAKEKLAATPVAPQPQTPTAPSSPVTSTSTLNKVVDKFSDILQSAENRRNQIGKFLDAPYDPEANKIFESLYNRIGIEIKTEKQFLEEIYKEVIMQSKGFTEPQFFEWLVNQKKARKITSNEPDAILSLMTPAEKLTARRAQDALADAAERYKLAFKSARTIIQRFKEEIKFSKDLPEQMRLGAGKILAKFVIDQLSWWLNYCIPYKARRVFNLQNTIYDYLKGKPKLKKILDMFGGTEHDLAPVRFQWVGGLLLGFTVNYALEAIKELAYLVIGRLSEPNVEKEEKSILTTTQATTLAIFDAIKDAVSVYVGGQLLPRWLGARETERLAASKGGMSKEESAAYLINKHNRLKYKLAFLTKYRAELAKLNFSTKQQNIKEYIKDVKDTIDTYLKRDEITEQEFSEVKNQVAEIKKLVEQEKISATAPQAPPTTQSNLPSIPSLPGVAKQPASPPSPTAGAGGEL